MIDAQLAPPPVAASRGSAPAGGSGGEDAPGAAVESDPTSFGAVLDRRSAPRSSDAPGTDTTRDAAGPQPGELPTEVVAEADTSAQTTVAEGVAVAIATAIVAAVPAVPAVPAATAAPAVTTTAAATPEGAAATPPQPIPGLVPATLDATGAVVPVLTPAQVQAQGPPSARAIAPGTLVAEGAKDGARAAPAATPSAAQGTTVTAPAATVTLTLTPTDTAATAGDGSAPAAPAPPAATAPATAPAPAAAAPAEDAPAPATAKPAEAPAPAPRTDLPVGVALVPPTDRAQHDPLAGVVRPTGGMTTPHELARELGTRMHMAVREGGKELLVNLRPPDLGHLTIRVTMTDGVLQAQILADRPEAAKLLQQSLGHLNTALGDLGYSLGNLDVAYGGRDDAQASSEGSDAPVSGEVLEAEDVSAAGSPTTSPAAGGSPPRLDLLA